MANPPALTSTTDLEYLRVYCDALLGAMNTNPGTFYIFVDTTSAPVAQTLPDGTVTPAATVKDKTGHAAAHNITVSGHGGALIDGAATSVINTNYGVRTFAWNGAAWSVVA